AVHCANDVPRLQSRDACVTDRTGAHEYILITVLVNLARPAQSSRGAQLWQRKRQIEGDEQCHPQQEDAQRTKRTRCCVGSTIQMAGAHVYRMRRLRHRCMGISREGARIVSELDPGGDCVMILESNPGAVHVMARALPQWRWHHACHIILAVEYRLVRKSRRDNNAQRCCKTLGGLLTAGRCTRAAQHFGCAWAQHRGCGVARSKGVTGDPPAVGPSTQECS